MTQSRINSEPNSAARRILRDGRDLPYLKLIAGLTLIFPPLALVFFYVDRIHPLVFAPYGLAIAFFMTPFGLMLHNLVHRPAFQDGYKWIEFYVTCVLGLLFGQIPFGFSAHHLGMHHPENNLGNDGSSTVRYRRDHAGDFFRYYLRFMLIGIPELAVYLWKNNRRKYFYRLVLGELTYWIVTACLFAWKPVPTLLVFWGPLFLVRFVLMLGNWTQHAFVDPQAPENIFRNSITCTDTPYNQRCFNDGFHTAHHLRSFQHWTEMPEAFTQLRSTYLKEQAIVFEKLDYLQVWIYLMRGRHDLLASRCLLSREMPVAEVEQLLRERVQPVQSFNA